MEALSPLYAALGIAEFEVINDLASWLDGRGEPSRTAEPRPSDRARWAPPTFGRKG